MPTIKTYMKNSKRKAETQLYRPSAKNMRMSKYARRYPRNTARSYNTSVIPRYPRPFKFPGAFTLDYESDLVHAGISATTFAGFFIAPNDLLDIDKSVASFFGNKQPYFFDSLFSSTGPYERYLVKSWQIEFTCFNTSDNAIQLCLSPPTTLQSNIDTYAEVSQLVETKKAVLGAKDSGSSKAIMRVSYTLRDVAPSISDLDFSGAYNGSPTNIIYHTLAVNNPSYSAGTYYLDLKVKVTVQVQAMYNDNTES